MNRQKLNYIITSPQDLWGQSSGQKNKANKINKTSAPASNMSRRKRLIPHKLRGTDSQHNTHSAVWPVITPGLPSYLTWYNTNSGRPAWRPVKVVGRCLRAGLKNARPCLPLPPGDGHSERHLSPALRPRPSFTPMKYTPGSAACFVAGDERFGSVGSLRDEEIAYVSLAVAIGYFCNLWIYWLFSSVPWNHFLNFKNVKKNVIQLSLYSRTCYNKFQKNDSIQCWAAAKQRKLSLHSVKSYICFFCFFFV